MLQSNIEEANAAARVGKRLCGQWHLDRLIDVGGMAAVYAATHPDGSRGAIKILKARAELTPEVSCAFLRKGHPNAVRILDDQVDDEGNVCVIMELLEGRTLREWAQTEGGKLTPDRVLRIVDQVLDGLAALHDAGIVHRDIKPENLFLTTSGQVKILDFGIACVSEKGANGIGEPKAGVVMGTPDFMSPEQARGRWDLVDAQSDLWSVGATAFTLLSGELVHNEPTLLDLLTAIFEKPARSLAAALPAVHPALVEVIDRSLQRRRADRWPDARTMQAALWSAFCAMYGTEMRFAAPAVHVPERTPVPQPVVMAAPEPRRIPGMPVRRLRRLRSTWVAAGALSVASLLIELPGSAPRSQAHAGDVAVTFATSAEGIEPSLAVTPASKSTARRGLIRLASPIPLAPHRPQ